MSQAIFKLIGRSTACDLVLEHPSVSRLHARINRAEDGRLLLVDDGSSNGTFLFRCGQWVRAHKISLCRDDMLRLGETTVRPEQLLSLFGPDNRVWLPALPVASGTAVQAGSGNPGDAPARLSRPRRNPETGQIEELPLQWKNHQP